MTMSLLNSLFPNLKGLENKHIIPIWEEENSPWSLVSETGNNNLFSQILNLNNKLGKSENIHFDNVILDETKGPIFIHNTAIIGEFVKIQGPCYIGKNVEIRHSAFLRKGNWICEGAVIGHSSEIKNSLLLPGSKAPHFNYVGDSILGFNVNIGAGVKLSNVRNDRRNILVSLRNGDKVNTKLRKFGAIIGDKSEIGCNVVMNPGSIIEANSKISPNLSIKGWFRSK